ncbi:transposase [Bradyrhizobium ottawaense]
MVFVVAYEEPSEKNISPLAKRLGFRRIATRYDKLARNYFSALCLVAAVAFWL